MIPHPLLEHRYSNYWNTDILKKDRGQRPDRHLLPRAISPTAQRHAWVLDQPDQREPPHHAAFNSVLAKTTGGQASGAEIAYEMNYGVAIAPGMAFKPFLQYISYPD
jgi:hypothetical protein